ncbi:MAG: hypothetical protein HQM16_02920 [Deltaproteobacteria bacterium]|nr:hypothetical protein [Deltaproteobacteria bacterium]
MGPSTQNTTTKMSLKAVKKRFKNFYHKHFENWFDSAEKVLSNLKNKTLLDKKGMWGPLVFVIAAITAFFSFGVAVLSLISFFGSLLVLYFIITSIFGLKLDLSDVVKV